MTTCLGAFIFAFVCAIIMTNAVRFAASLYGVVDRPDKFRKVHDHPIPRLGGVGVYGAFFLTLAVLCFMIHNQVTDRLPPFRRELVGLFLGSTVALTMGWIDDVRGMKPRWKLLFQAIAGAAAWCLGLSITAISNPFGPAIELGLYSFPITVFWFVGCMNAVNLMDGLDGLAAGICIFVSLTLFLVCLLFHNVTGMVLMACFSGAVFGFLLFNFYPAKIFLGDSGSMLLGFLIGALSLVGAARKAETAIALLTPMVALGLPIFDTVLTIVRRWYHRLPLASADRQHVHHILIGMGLSQRRAVLTLYFTTLVLGGAALLITVERSELTILILGALALIAFVCVRVLGGLRIGDVFDRFSQAQERRRFAGYARVSIEKAVAQMGFAKTVEELWLACSNAFNDIGIDFVHLRPADETAAFPPKLSWTSRTHAENRHPAASDAWVGHLRLLTADRDLGHLHFGKHSADPTALTDVPELMDLLRKEIVLNLRRLAPAVATNPAS